MIKQFDICYVDFGNNIGSEQSGVRPALVVQNNMGNKYSPTTLVIPISSKIKFNPMHVLIKKDKRHGLKKDSIALGEQLRVVDKTRISNRIGHVSDEKIRNEIFKVCQANFGL